MSIYVCMYIYMYVCIVLFDQVKPDLQVIPSGKKSHSRAEHLDFPGRVVNVINSPEQYFFKDKTKECYIRIINLFPSCFCLSGVKQKHEEI